MIIAVGRGRFNCKLSPPRVELLVNASEPPRIDMGVPLRRGDAGVAEHLLDMPQVDTTSHQMGGETVPQGMR